MGARGRGLGAELITRGVERLMRKSRVQRVVALVRRENEPSQRAFEKAGFARDGECDVAGQPAVRWTRGAA